MDLQGYKYDPSISVDPSNSCRIIEPSIEFSPQTIQDVLSLPKTVSFVSYSDKQRRCYRNCLQGLIRAMNFHQRCSFLTLTSGRGFDVRRLCQCFQTLRKRVYHHWGFLMQYLSVRTSEGNGVLHVVFVGEYINSVWLSKTWSEITHGISKIIKIKEIRLDKKTHCKSMARYMTQYMAGQQKFQRFSRSWNWIFKGSTHVWQTLVSKHGVQGAIPLFERLLTLPSDLIAKILFLGSQYFQLSLSVG